jgi:ketosteroid isomerase-like protein
LISEETASKVVLDFISKINNRDIEGLVSLMSDTHKFTDGLGQVTVGKKQMREGWTQYFAMFPDYHVAVQNVFEAGNIVGIFGTASGTFAENNVSTKSGGERFWEIPAAWRAVVRKGLVVEWQVYADNEPVWKIMGIKRY